MGAHYDSARVHAEATAQWRDWLVENHAAAEVSGAKRIAEAAAKAGRGEPAR